MAKHVLASAERTIDAPAHDVYRYLGDTFLAAVQLVSAIMGIN